MRVAAYQAPLLVATSGRAIESIRDQVERCELNGVDVLCCPEAILGGLADNVANPDDIAIDVRSGQLEEALRPCASSRVTTIVGFTESADGLLYNSAAVYHEGGVMGVYRKRHPAIRRSRYSPGGESPVFRIPDLTFGIMICNDSNDAELARTMASRDATVLFIPTNNALRPESADVIDEVREVDAASSTRNGVWNVRADVAGRAGDLISMGSSAIVDPKGDVVAAAAPFIEDLLVADVGIGARRVHVR